MIYKENRRKNLTLTILSLSLLTVMAGAAVAPALNTIKAYFNGVNQTLTQMIISIPVLPFPHKAKCHKDTDSAEADENSRDKAIRKVCQTDLMLTRAQMRREEGAAKGFRFHFFSVHFQSPALLIRNRRHKEAVLFHLNGSGNFGIAVSIHLERFIIQ